MNLFETLIHPDKEEDDDRSDVIRAANLLQIGEFQILQLAYEDWYGAEMPEGMIDRAFHAYMLHGEAPHWAKYYTKRIFDLEASGQLDDRDPRFHRYDAAYITETPHGLWKFLVASGICLLTMVLMAFAAYEFGRTAHIQFPPHVTDEELQQTPSGDNNGAD